MTYILRADEGKWLYYYQQIGVLPDPATDEEMLSFAKEVRTSVPQYYQECTDEWKLWYKEEWQKAHEEPAPEPEPEGGEVSPEQEEEGGEV